MTVQSTDEVQVASQNTMREINQVQSVTRTVVWVSTFTLVVLILLALTLLIVGLSNRILLREEARLGILLCWGTWGIVALGLALIVPGMFSRTLYIIPEYQRVVVLKLGEFVDVKGPGRFWIIPYPPFYESMALMLDLRIQTHVIHAAETLTKDNVPVGCEAVVFWRVEDPRVAALKVQNHAQAVYLAANSALKDTIGQLELSELLSHREMVANNLKLIIDKAAEQFGVDVSSVEITDVHVPSALIQELSVRAQSERAAQAKITEAKAEMEVANHFERAARAMSPQAMEIYRLNVLERIGRGESGQIVIYGLGQDPATGKQIAASAAGARAAT
jgi:regulator of protease activity HflC (stomatin/prohibitin superfamily)